MPFDFPDSFRARQADERTTVVCVVKIVDVHQMQRPAEEVEQDRRVIERPQ